jgi:hypothetical protein
LFYFTLHTFTPSYYSINRKPFLLFQFQPTTAKALQEPIALNALPRGGTVVVPGELRVMLPAASDPCGRPDMPYTAQQRLKTSIQMLGRTFVNSLVEADVMCTYPVRATSVHSPQVCVYTVYTVFKRGLM